MVDWDDLKCRVDREESLNQVGIGTSSLVERLAQEKRKRQA